MMLLVLVLAAIAGEQEFYRAAALERDGRSAEAAEVYRSITEGPFADDALAELARLLEERLADPVAAAGAYERLVREFPESRLATRARRRAEALRAALGPDPRAVPAVAELSSILLGSAGRPREESIARMEALLAQWPDLPETPRALFWLGGALLEDGRRDEALVRLREAQRRFPGIPWAARAARAEGDLLLDLGDLDGAERAYASLPDEDGRRAALTRVATARGRRQRATLGWIVVGLGALAAVVETRRVSGRFRPLLRPPIEAIYFMPMAVLFVIAAATENVAMTRAVTWICVGGLVTAWLSGATLEAARAAGRPVRGTRAIVHALVAATAMVAVCYISCVEAGIVDFLLETLRFGPER